MIYIFIGTEEYLIKKEIENIIGIEAMEAPCVSAKTGLNMERVLDEIVEKYGYQDNVRRAIEIAIPLMVKKYGENRL